MYFREELIFFLATVSMSQLFLYCSHIEAILDRKINITLLHYTVLICSLKDYFPPGQGKCNFS